MDYDKIVYGFHGCDYTTDAGLEMPRNSNIRNDSDWKMRFLDCAVIQTFTKQMKMSLLKPLEEPFQKAGKYTQVQDLKIYHIFKFA